jgi:rRNA biogenesis protein RRP5
MAGQKRVLDEPKTTRHSKKPKTADNGKAKRPESVQPTSTLLTEEVDFPRGGGTTLTPAEVKATRAEGIKEANEELIKVCPGCGLIPDD